MALIKYKILISPITKKVLRNLLMSRDSEGLMVKINIKDYYLVRPLTTAMLCLYIKRESSEKEKDIWSIGRKTKIILWRKILNTFSHVPEGTTTCSWNILKFKKGTFHALLPVKPVIINHYQESKFHLSIGAGAAVMSYFKNFCHLLNLYI